MLALPISLSGVVVNVDLERSDVEIQSLRHPSTNGKDAIVSRKVEIYSMDCRKKWT